MERSAKERWFDWLWLLAWGVASSAWCVGAAWQLGATFDEPIYLARGLERWRTGSHSGLMQLGTMPLPVDLDTLPLYLWERWHGTPLDPENDLPRVLPWARVGTLLFWWLLLLYARLAGRQLAGPWGGRLAVALIACEPNFLAHASLATTDIAVTACLLALVYHFRTGRDGGWVRRVGLPAFWFGAAVLAKASGLVFGPLCMLVVELERLARAGDFRTAEGGWKGRLRQVFARLQPFRRDVTRIVLLGLALAFVYCGCDWRPERTFVAWSRQLPAGTKRSVMVWLADHLRIFSNAGEGLIRQVKHNVRGHGVFLLGRGQPRSIWYYFPVALTIKLTLPLLILPLVLAALRPRALLNWAWLAAMGLLVFSLTCRVQIGIRLVLPLVAFGIVGLAAASVHACRGWRERAGGQQAGGSGRPARVHPFAALVGGGLVWTAVAAASVWPHGLCYVNELWGGTANGYRRLSDSNYDWGQGLRELAAWSRRHGVGSLDVWYFGTDPRFRSPPFHHLPLHGLPLGRPEDVVNWVGGRYLAVSTTLLYGMAISSPAHRQAVAFLRARRPTARTTTFFIFDLARDQARR
jgi:hypothetical protein